MTRTRILFASVALLALGGLTACDPAATRNPLNFGTSHDEGPADETSCVTYPNSQPLADGSTTCDPGNGGPPIIFRPPSNPYPDVVIIDNAPVPCGTVDPGTGGPPIIYPCTNR